MNLLFEILTKHLSGWESAGRLPVVSARLIQEFPLISTHKPSARPSVALQVNTVGSVSAAIVIGTVMLGFEGVYN